MLAPAPVPPAAARPAPAGALLRVRAAHRIDFGYLERVAGGDAAYVVLMARMFCAHFSEQLFLAEAAAARADARALRRELNRLATTCQLLGLPRLVALARQLDGRLGPAAAVPPAAAAAQALHHLRRGGMAAMRTLADELHLRYPQALAELLNADA